MSVPADLTAQDFKNLRLVEFRVRCVEAIFSGGSVAQREDIGTSAQRLYDFVIKDLFDEVKKD